MTREQEQLLVRVELGREERDAAQMQFEVRVVRAHDAGCSIREIAKAAGYSSPSPIQNIISKQKGTP